MREQTGRPPREKVKFFFLSNNIPVELTLNKGERERDDETERRREIL